MAEPDLRASRGFPSARYIEPSPALEPAIEKLVTPETAERAAREVLGHLIAGKIDDAAPLLDTRLIANLSPDSRSRIDQVTRGYGKVKAIDVTGNDACQAGRCLAFALETAHGSATATFQMHAMFGRWQITDFDLSPPEK